MVIKFDPSKKGLRTILKEYQEHALRYIWEVGEEGAGSRKVHEETKKRLSKGKAISRASIIIFLDEMVEKGVLNYHEETGKGGYHRVYTPKMSEEDFVKHLVRTVVEGLIGEWSSETGEAINEILL